MSPYGLEPRAYRKHDALERALILHLAANPAEMTNPRLDLLG